MHVNVEDWHDAEEVDLITKFVRHSVGLILPEETTETLRITVKSDLGLLDLNLWGDCIFADGGRENPTEFVVRVARRAMSFQQSLKVLGHEVRHVTQYTTGRLQHTRKPNIMVWKGKLRDTEEMSHWFEPWEEEARGAEKGFLENFVEYYRLRAADWYRNEP